MPIDLVIDEREGGTKLEGLPGESSSTDLRTTLTSSKNFIRFNINLQMFFIFISNSMKAIKIR